MRSNKVVLGMILSIGLTGACRSTNPVRRVDGKKVEIPIERTVSNTEVSWRIESPGNIKQLTKSPKNSKQSLEGAENPMSLGEAKKVMLGQAVKDWPVKVTYDNNEPAENLKAVFFPGEYGGAYLLQIVETVPADDGKVVPPHPSSAENAGAKAGLEVAAAKAIPSAAGSRWNPGGKTGPDIVVRNTVTTLDDREQALGYGAEVGLLFIPELDAAVTSTMVSLYPGRLWAIDSTRGPRVSQLTDRISVDAGIIGGSVIGNAPDELAGRTAFSLGLGFFFAKGWSAKAGLVLYKDATDNDNLTNAAYWGLTYDLLSGLTNK